MPITPIPDLNIDRKLADDFSVRLVKRDGDYRVLISCAVVAGPNEIVIANFGVEDIWEQLSANQQNTVRGLITSAQNIVKSLLEL